MKKVFVSSKQGELDPERAALHQALQSAEWDNFAIEFSGAFPDSVRDVFLKSVAECDVYLGIFASIYSQPTVDEYHKAKELGKPILIYLKKCATRDSQLQDFIRAELQSSHKYQEFSTLEELVNHLPDIRRALDAEVQKHQRQAYLDALVAQTELLELTGIVNSGENEHPKLPEIFVALSAAEEVDERKKSQPRGEREPEHPIKNTRRVTIEQALVNHRNLIILGDPGAGKSTLLRYLTLVAAQGDVETLHAMSLRESSLPILVRLSSFAQSGQSFIEYFETNAEKQLHISLGKKFFDRALEDGQTIVCLDGLDEVSQPAQRIDVRNAITALVNRYPRNRFIVTSRVVGYDSASLDKRTFAHHTIVPFGENEIQAFVEKWYAACERESEQAKMRAKNLFNDLKANERLMKLAENPLALTIIALVHQRAKGKLPDTRVELYDRYAETLIEEWDKWKGLAPEDRERPHYRLRRRWLERTAYWMHIESQEVDVAQISRHALEIKVAEFLVEDKTLNLSEDSALIEAKQFVALVTSRMGILVAREQGAVSFIHLTFQEYFAASDLYCRYRKVPDALWQAIQPHLYDSRWLEVILLLLGRLNDEGDTTSVIVEKVLREHDKFDDVIHRDLFLAARILADEVNVRETLHNEIVDTLLKFVTEEYLDHIFLQYDSFNSLGTLRGNARVGAGLLTFAQDDKMNAWIRSRASQTLGQLGFTNDAVRLLLALARDDKADTGVRINAARALGELGCTENAVQLLLSFAQDEKAEVDDRVGTVMILGRVGRTDDAAMQGLLAFAQDKNLNVWMRGEAVEALGQLGRTDDLVIQGLMALAQDEKVASTIRGSALQVLSRLLHTDEIAHMLLMILQGEKVEVLLQCWIAQALEWLGSVDVARHLFLAMVQDNNIDPYARVLAAVSLGPLGHTNEVMSLLLVLAQDTNNNIGVRCDAIEALGSLSFTNDQVIKVLTVLIQDEKLDWRLQKSAALALGQLGRKDNIVIQPLLQIVRDNRVHLGIQDAAAQALGRLGKNEPRVADVFWALANQKVSWVSYDAYRALKEVVGNMRYRGTDEEPSKIPWWEAVKMVKVRLLALLRLSE